jgi:signal transduction histidine kinase
MEMSVNNLSEKLATMATFAQEVGERNFEAEYQPLSREDVLGEALVVMRNNIRRSDENLRAKNEALTKTNMELDKFVYSVSHDLRAPLSSMLGVIDLSLEQTEDPLMSKHFEMLKSSVKKLDAFIQDILDYSRNARMEVMSEKIDFKELIHDITGNLKFMSGTNRRVEIKTNIHESQPFYGDRNRLSVVLNNLVSNAIRYQDVEKENPFVDISIDASATEAIIRISDNGIGISKEHHQKIFEMFYRVSDRSVGSGLGLYLVKDVMDKLGGTIQMESTPGQGTAFNLWIPAVVALHQ